MTVKIDRTLTESENITQYLKEKNPDLTGDLTIAIVDPEGEFNTSIKATAKANSNASGSNVYHYDRLDLSAGGVNEEAYVEYEALEGQTDAELAEAVADKANIISSATTFTKGEPGEGGIWIGTFTAKEDSLVYLPGTQYTVTVVPFVEEEPEPEEPVVPDYITDPFVEVAPLTEDEVTPEGTLWVGSNNPSTDLTKVSNGELSLATSARKYRSTETIAPVDSTYTIALEPGEDWNFPLAIALINAPAGTLVTDLYDVAFTINSLDEGTSLEFDLTHDGESYHLVNEEKNLDIDDNISIPNGLGMQNIQRLRFYATELGLTQFNSDGATLGNFQLTFTAIRKEGNVEPLELIVNVVTDPATAPAEV